MLDDNDFRTLLQHLGRPWGGYRKVRKGVMKRLRSHMAQLDCRTLESYLAIIERDQQAWEICQDHLKVTISRFFRDRQVWRHLEERLLRELLDRYPQGLAVWSAGGAGGEEPYSLAILWQQMGVAAPLSLLATDARGDCLERARRGVYSRSSLRELVPETVCRYFCRQETSGHYAIRPQLKEQISWRQHDLLDEPPAGPFQLIFLRNNLLTYYQQPLVSPAFLRIASTLSPGGLLITGSHEKLPESVRFLRRDPHCPMIYRAVAC